MALLNVGSGGAAGTAGGVIEIEVGRHHRGLHGTAIRRLGSAASSPAALLTWLKGIVRAPVWRGYVWLFQNTGWIQRMIARPYLNRPLAGWPPRVGRILDVAVPRGVGRLPAPSPACGANIDNLIDLLERTRQVDGDVAECGVFRGASLTAMALYAAQQGIDKTFHGFDSFEGFAPGISKDLLLGGAPLSCKLPGGMSETSYQLVSAKAKALQLRNVRLYKGYFEQTLSQCANRFFSLVHLDCDAYDPYVECLEFFYPRLSPGGVILLDEYNDPAWPGCNRAVDAYLAGRPERLQVIAEDNYEKYFIVKQ
jgi:hypothetical protein